MGGVDKLWADLSGEPVVTRSLRILASAEGITEVIVVTPSERHEAIHAQAANLPVPVRCVEGGARRQDSVAAGLRAAPEADYYLVHDAARPLVTTEVCARVLAAAREHGAAIPAVPVVDTIKRVDEAGLVLGTVHREPLRAVQTPQAFAGALLRRAHAEVQADVTDDAAMVEHLGAPVVTAEGDPANIKITTAGDLDLVRALLSAHGS